MFPQNSMRRMRGAVLENKTIHSEMIKALMTAILSQVPFLFDKCEGLINARKARRNGDKRLRSSLTL